MKSVYCDICSMPVKNKIKYDEDEQRPNGLEYLVWSAAKMEAIDNPSVDDIKTQYPVLKYLRPYKDVDICQECLIQISTGFVNWMKGRRTEAVHSCLK